MPFVGSRLDDLGDLAGRVPELLVRAEVVRPEPDPGIGTELAQDLPLRELTVDGLELGCAHGHGPAAPGEFARTADLESGGLEQVDQELRLSKRVGTDPLDADFLDQVVACG